MLHKASQTRNTIVAGAEELLQASRVQAEREAVAIVDAGREQVRALEDDAAQRMADLDTEHRELTQKLSVMETLYNELRETLQLVTETSISELVEAQESLHQLDPAATQGPPSESTADRATDSATEKGSVADQEASSGLESVDPAPVEVPPLPGR
jgi:predicted nuclease with TOPRIM domain